MTSITKGCTKGKICVTLDSSGKASLQTDLTTILCNTNFDYWLLIDTTKVDIEGTVGSASANKIGIFDNDKLIAYTYVVAKGPSKLCIF